MGQARLEEVTPEDRQKGFVLLEAREIPPLEKFSLRQAVIAALRPIVLHAITALAVRRGALHQAVDQLRLAESQWEYPGLLEGFWGGVTLP